jgi:mono/diheme cytochrome c family protein
MKKLLIFFVIFIGVIIVGCNKSENKAPQPTAAVENIPGKDVYTKYCRLCHGSKGDLGLSGSANLTISALSLVEVKHVVVNGRNAMPAWGKQLSEQEIDEVAAYVLSLRN